MTSVLVSQLCLKVLACRNWT